MKKLLVWLMLAAVLLTGCGPKDAPANDSTISPEPAEPVIREPEQTVETLPEAFPMTLHFSSGAGGWQTELTLQRDGTFSGQFHDSEMGSMGDGYPNGTLYLCEFEGRFGNFQTVDDTTLSLTLEELTALTPEDEIWFEEGMRCIGATPYGLEDSTKFLLYGPETPWETLSDSALMGWPLSGEPTFTLDCWGLCNTAQQQTFFDWSYWFPEDNTAEEPASQETDPKQEPVSPPEASSMAVYDIEGIRIPLPAEYLPHLVVNTPEDFCAEELNPHSLPLLTVYDKASLEAEEAEYGTSGYFGFLFGISRMDRVGFEELVEYDIPGCAVFATDGTYYYAVTFPTDVQFYRAEYDESLPSWESLCTLQDTVPQEVIDRNGLTPYSQWDLHAQPFTYQGNHAYVNYYPYVSVDGSHDSFYTLVLSQPATQGAGGIWCVERMVDANGNTHLIFPGQDVPAAEWYAARQAAHDEGLESHLLTTLGAAEDFLHHRGWLSGEAAEGSLEETTSMDEGYIDANRKLNCILPDLLIGREPNPEEVLACLAAFRKDTWAFMGRSYYGSDWWPPLLSAVEDAAIGEDQEIRCAALQNFYLTSYGQYEEALRPLLQAQFESDPEAFEAALAQWSETEQAALRVVPGF